MKLLIKYANKFKYFGLRKLYYTVNQINDFIYSILIDIDIVVDSNVHQSLVKRNISKLLIQLDSYANHENLNYYQYFLGFGLVHYSFIRNIKPYKILCIGYSNSIIPAISALACKDNTIGTVDYINPTDLIITEESKKNTEHINNIYIKLGIKNHIKTYSIGLNKFLRVHKTNYYQYIFIDSNYSYKDIKNIYALAYARLYSGGFIALNFPNSKINKTGFLSSTKLWNELKEKNSIFFGYPSNTCLGIIQKK